MSANHDDEKTKASLITCQLGSKTKSRGGRLIHLENRYAYERKVFTKIALDSKLKVNVKLIHSKYCFCIVFIVSVKNHTN